MADIAWDHVGKTFSGGVDVIPDLSLDTRDGEFMVLVGPSGSGKSTALRMVAGLEEVSRGRIRIGERDVTHIAPRDRDVAMVFQNYALYPHMTVEDNMSFALKLRHMDGGEREKRVTKAAEMLGLEPYLKRKPSELSGGQRQRVAMGRAIVREPKAFLMDEPLSNLDAKLRVSMRASLSALHKRLGITTVYVTHDQIEAMTLGDRVSVLRDGKLQQCDTPQQLFDAPANLFVAGFIGSPAMNMVEAKLDRDNGAVVVFGSYRLPVPESTLAAWPELGRFFGRSVILGIRPNNFEEASINREPDWPVMQMRAVVTEELGTEINVLVDVDAPPVQAAGADKLREESGDAEAVSVAANHSLWTARVSPKARVTPGETVHLAVDAAALHFFDQDTGLAIGHPQSRQEVRGDDRRGDG